MPKISVVIPTFNAGLHIQATLSSILAQEDADFEVLILDDASTDNTLDLIRDIGDKRVKIYRHENNQGRIVNANRAFSLASGEYVARLDHDDIADPRRLFQQARFLDEHPQITVVGSQIQHFGLQQGNSDFPLEDGRIKARFVSGDAYLANPSVMFRHDFIQRNVLRYDPNLYITDDLGFWFDCLLLGARFANLPNALTSYRIHEGMTSMNLDADLLYRGKERLYARLLPAFFPRLSGHDIRNLMPLYKYKVDAPLEPESLRALHRSVAVALREVNLGWGLDIEETKACLVSLLNRLRAEWVQADHLDAKDIAALDREFYLALQ
ncbi:Glycosyl transferase family 2 [Collimonas sp. OK307]|uniref:glycosyltransferase family 2 protein n=1 Tax=Collimonas sp. OK307 TaxID=1801620 RepID=UPI0008EA93B5|nr:glycosyltransferase [Collimonas sp. OK307]SFI44119.1 Glycosyl transferase family 2 [Collimonas sp. OK307]